MVGTSAELKEKFAGHMGEPVLRSDLRVGDRVLLAELRAVSYAGVHGAAIVSKGPKNIVVLSEYRACPGGPLYSHKHKIPREHVVAVQRGETVHEIVERAL